MVLKLETITAEDNRVLAEVRGANKTVDGEDYNNRYVFFMEFDGGKIKTVREYLDTALVEKVLGPRIVPIAVP